MNKALLIALALMGLPLGLEAQTVEDLVNEVLAGRETEHNAHRSDYTK
jgi:hypothetical protein